MGALPTKTSAVASGGHVTSGRAHPHGPFSYPKNKGERRTHQQFLPVTFIRDGPRVNRILPEDSSFGLPPNMVLARMERVRE